VPDAPSELNSYIHPTPFARKCLTKVYGKIPVSYHVSKRLFAYGVHFPSFVQAVFAPLLSSAYIKMLKVPV
jgi:hypothetical protein